MKIFSRTQDAWHPKGYTDSSTALMNRFNVTACHISKAKKDFDSGSKKSLFSRKIRRYFLSQREINRTLAGGSRGTVSWVPLRSIRPDQRMIRPMIVNRNKQLPWVKQVTVAGSVSFDLHVSVTEIESTC